MDAELLLRRRTDLTPDIHVERVLWLLSEPARGSMHRYKYRFKYRYKYRYALIVDDVCVMRYDNEAGKGDHKHFDGAETAYRFIDGVTLLNDFFADVRRWRRDDRRD